MKKLILDQKYLDALREFREKETILFTRCGKTGREIRITCFGSMQVWKNGELKYEGIQPWPVIEAFNRLA